jgi:hypothetical protein
MREREHVSVSNVNERLLADDRDQALRDASA